MPSTNGTLHAVADPTDDDALDLGDLVSETKTVTVIREGQPVRLTAFVYETAPVSVFALIAQAHDQYIAVLRDENNASVHHEFALWRYHAAIAKALVAGLSHDEQDRLGGDGERLMRLLNALGFPPKLKAVEGEAEGDQVASTTAISSPDSEPSTVAPTPIG